jgi:hypothetical protein
VSAVAGAAGAAMAVVHQVPTEAVGAAAAAWVRPDRLSQSLASPWHPDQRVEAAKPEPPARRAEMDRS